MAAPSASNSSDSIGAKTRHFQPLSYLTDGYDKKIVLLVLNTEIENPDRFHLLWNKAIFKALADGACNRVFELDQSEGQECIPDIISGDFDSARTEVLQHYKSRGTKIISTPDQNATDFTKCLKLVIDRIHENGLRSQVDCIVVYVEYTGRFDHVLANLNTLFIATETTQLPIYLMSGKAVSFVLPQGMSSISVDTGLEGSWCGLIPLGCPCDHVTTTGLKWNLNDRASRFGQLVSTSNALDGSAVVTVETDKPMIWTMGVKDSS